MLEIHIKSFCILYRTLVQYLKCQSISAEFHSSGEKKSICFYYRIY